MQNGNASCYKEVVQISAGPEGRPSQGGGDGTGGGLCTMATINHKVSQCFTVLSGVKFPFCTII